MSCLRKRTSQPLTSQRVLGENEKDRRKMRYPWRTFRGPSEVLFQMVAGMASKSGWLFFPGEPFRFARPRLPLVASGAI